MFDLLVLNFIIKMYLRFICVVVMLLLLSKLSNVILIKKIVIWIFKLVNVF